jgi:hypothetical protein
MEWRRRTGDVNLLDTGFRGADGEHTGNIDLFLRQELPEARKMNSVEAGDAVSQVRKAAVTIP